jgi:hypothetical protein
MPATCSLKHRLLQTHLHKMSLLLLLPVLVLSATPTLQAAARGAVPQHQLEAKTAPWFCHDLDCPPYEVIRQLSEDVEVRTYQAGEVVGRLTPNRQQPACMPGPPPRIACGVPDAKHAGAWVSTNVSGMMYDNAISKGFMVSTARR